MFRTPLIHKIATLAGTLMILLGLGLVGWAVANFPSAGAVRQHFDEAFAQDSAGDRARTGQSPSPPSAPDTLEGSAQQNTAPDTVGSDQAVTDQGATDQADLSPPVTVQPTPRESQETGRDSEQDGETEANRAPRPAGASQPAITLTLDKTLPAALRQAVNTLAAADARYITRTVDAPAAAHESSEQTPGASSSQAIHLTWQNWSGRAEGAPAGIGIQPGNQDQEVLYRQFFAAATRFDTIDLNVRLLQIRRAWQGDSRRFDAVAVHQENVPALTQILGEPGDHVQEYATMEEVVEAAWRTRDVLALVPFHQLTPQLAVFSVDGQTPVENATKFILSAYPLVADVYAVPSADVSGATLTHLAAQLPSANRNSRRLTVVAMTGVTAMVRFTAEQMDARGPDWPAEIVGPELATADITAISNEVPFVPDCETNTDPENLVFCSKPDYMEALERSGADVIGLTGNHQNDFGLENALTSLEIYAEANLPVYGGGATKAEALRPLIMEHNGNRIAFLGANSYGPPSAWATEFSPGSAPFDLSMMSAAIRELKNSDTADLVLAELQYQESYDVEPLMDQRLDFGALARAGADIVTGVQSHVPQSIEFVEDGLVLYGLGNLFFDQMWTEDTREGLIVKHTIYEGRHISTQILPTLLHDYGQPRWPDAERRAAILAKVFAASYWD